VDWLLRKEFLVLEVENTITDKPDAINKETLMTRLLLTISTLNMKFTRNVLKAFQSMLLKEKTVALVGNLVAEKVRLQIY
jgi:hypothetical protein